MGRLVVGALLAGALPLVVGCPPPVDPVCREGPWDVSSPDGALTVRVRRPSADEAARFSSASLMIEVPGLEPSPLGLLTDRGSMAGEGCVAVQGTADVDETYTATVGKRRERSVRASILLLQVAPEEGDPVDVEVRVHPDGVAWRYRVRGEGEAELIEDASGFSLPEGAPGWMAPYDILGGLLAGSYETVPTSVVAGDETLSSGWAFPALFRLDDAGERWALLTESDLDGTSCGARLGPVPDGTTYRIALPTEEEGNGVGAALPRSSLPWTMPWRVIVLGDLATVVGSTLVDDLARPSRIDDTLWIRPGRVAWSWFSQDTGDVEQQRRYIDFASDLGWEYVLIDAGWDQWPDLDTVMPALVDEAEARGVRLFLWYNSGGEHSSQDPTPKDRMLDPTVRAAELDRIAAWGIAGIKVDFFDSDKQDRIQQYLGILEDTAARELLVNFHGATLPRGWPRTWPNLLAQEAVRGVEWYQGGGVGGPNARTHVVYAFLRNVVGSMDYTPVAFEAGLAGRDLPYGHSLALAVLFESGLVHFADRADGSVDEGFGRLFDRFPFARPFFEQVPTVWDDTRLLAGDPEAGFVVLARRAGARWYVAGIHAHDEPFVLALDLSSLTGGGPAEPTCLGTGAAPDSLVESTPPVAASGSLSLSLAARDGFVCWLEP